ncbi:MULTISPECIES: type IV secretion system DNA-binding domain-containing protein [Sphingomonas]|uniref:type IV secretion system DNA-binding domain-containing protein n=1 Tax=Sphingomonas TaxID=13687 RepID=UPI0008373602|nr:type IV secretion system DNA-binding domain-containing protein [Sphingomonas sp. CCH10-B3]
MTITVDQLEAAHWLVVGTTGSGKTYLARGLLEQLRRADRRVGAVDKLGKLWGLTLSANGTGPGLEFVIFGGKRAQVPMRPDQGAVIGRLFVEQNIPAIFDLSQWKAPDSERWVADFSEAVFAANTTALHLVFDEAQSWVPQNGGGPAYDAVRLLAEQGRGNGINLLLTAPRMAGLDANVRGAIAAMVAMRQTLDIDIKRTAETIGAHLTIDDRAFRTELPTLPTGTGYVWSPTGARIERVAFTPNTTFDSSRTPRHGDTPPAPIAISSSLVDELRAALMPPVETEKPESQKSGFPHADTHAALEARISELEAIVADQRAELEHLRGVDAECEAYSAGLTALDQLVRSIQSGEFRANLHSGDADFKKHLSRVSDAAAGSQGKGSSPPIAGMPERGDADVPHEAPAATSASAGPAADVGAFAAAAKTRGGATIRIGAPAAGDVDLPPRRIRILEAIAAADGVMKTSTPSRRVVAWLAETMPSSSTFEKDLGALRTLGLIDYPAAGLVTLTRPGRDRLGRRPVAPATRDALLALIARKLPPRRADIIRALWPIRDDVTRKDLARYLNISPSSSTFEKDLGALRTLGLIDYPAQGMVQLAAVFRA